MNIGHWLKSLSSSDQIILVLIYSICIYLSKLTLESLIEYYDTKKRHSEFRIRYRVTPAALLSLALLYSFLIYQILFNIFGFIP